MARLKKRLSHFKVLIFFIISGIISFHWAAQAQLNNFDMTRANKYKVDTLAKETSQKILEETAGLMEREIDPEKYILGPNDKLILSIISSNSKEFDLVVSPSGRLLIPEVGAVSLKGKTLAEAEKLVKEKVQKVYKTDDVFLVIKKIRTFKVIVSGQVMMPSIVAATHVDRVSEVIEKAGGFEEDASMRNIQILREGESDIINVDLRKFFATGRKEYNPYVLGGDVIMVPPSNEKNKIEVFGEIKYPKDFEFVEGDSLSTLLKFGQGFLRSSFLDSVEIVRYARQEAGIARWFVNLEKWRNILFSGQPLEGDIPLMTGDRVFVRANPDWFEEMNVKIEGEVKYPGSYAINKSGVRVFDLLQMAGGVKVDGSLDAAILVRTSEEDIEDKQMERLRSIPPSEMNENEVRYFQARALEIKGIMAINFENIVNNPNSDENILLMDKDSIYVPLKKFFVGVQGRVNNPGLIVYKPEYNYLDYINLAGGFGFRADIDETFIVKLNNQQFLAEDVESYHIEPGDNILVPPEKETSLSFADIVNVIAQGVTIIGIAVTLMNMSK